VALVALVASAVSVALVELVVPAVSVALVELVVPAVPVVVIVRPPQATFQPVAVVLIVHPPQAIFLPVAVLVIVRQALAISPPAAAVLEVLVPALSPPVVVAPNGSTTPNIAKVFPIVTTPQTRNTTDHQPEISLVTIHFEGETELARVGAHVTSVGTVPVRVTSVVAVETIGTVRAHATPAGTTVAREVRAIPGHLVA